MEATSTIILIGSGLLVASILTSVAAMRFGAPLLLIFLAVGLIAGEDGLGIKFNDPQTAYLVGSAALAVILFESGFDTKLQSYRAAAGPALTLATLGVLVTAGLAGAAAHYLLGLTWLEGLLLGAVISSTDAAAVFFLLRVGGITIRDRVRSSLEIESGANDPMAILLTVVLVEALRHGGGGDAWAMAELFIRQMGLGLVLGLIGGVLLVAAINMAGLDNALNPVVSLAFALFIFAGTNIIEGSGFLAVYVAGLAAGNSSLKGAAWLRRFHAGLTWLSQIVMFVMLGLFATPSSFGEILLPALALAAFLILVARPAAVWLSLSPFRFKANETAFLAWVGLRGAVSLLLALVPILGDLPHGAAMFNVAFVVVVVSLTVQGWTIRPMAHRLGLIVPQRTGPVQRVELELPDEVSHELVAYTVHPQSPVGQGQHLPRWARPALVLRGGKVVALHRAQPLQPRDHVYMFVARHRLALHDKLFAAAKPLDQDDREFFGDMALTPNISAGQLAAIYGLEVPAAKAGLTLAEMFQQEFSGAAEPGDRIRLGEVELILRERDDKGRILSVGLALEPGQATKPKAPLFFDLWKRLRR
jgi:potassium/hydrogen antiporter